MRLLGAGLAIGFAVEAITLILRFYFGLQSTRDTALIGNFTGGIRIHHGYIGVLLMLIIYCSISQASIFSKTMFTFKHWLFALGVGLLISDLVHHFLVLWIMTGDPQFDLVYPGPEITAKGLERQ